MKLRKVLIPVPGLDLSLPLGAMNAVWQYLKGMYEVGLEPVVVPYLGKSIDSLWWKSYTNPCRIEGTAYLKIQQFRQGISGQAAPSGRSAFVPRIARALIRPKWKKRISEILDREKDIDAVLFWGLPLNHLVGIPSFIKKRYGLPVVFFDADLPFSLPKYGGFTFNYYPGADLSEYDAICGNSETALSDLIELGAKEAHAVHFGVDPDLFSPVPVREQDIDVFFSAWGERDREKWIEDYITYPSKTMKSRFVVAGGGFRSDLGAAKVIPYQPPPSLRYYICRSKLNLSITRQSVMENLGSNSRPFELGAMGACIISNPGALIERWFNVGKELFVAHNGNEAMELYEWLLDDEETRRVVGERVRTCVLREHTFKNRVEQLVGIIERFL